MFERFTDRARRVIILAQSEARLLNHNYIGTEHILLGLVQEGEGIAAKALESLDVPLQTVRDQVTELIGRGQEPPTGHIPFTPRAKKVLELALREALNLGHNYIGTEHLLLGLVREGEGVAAQILKKLGTELAGVRHAVIEIMSGYTGRPPDEVQEGLQTAGVKDPDPDSWPLCPRCRGSLEETASYRVLELRPPEGEGETRAVPFAFCGRCGTWLGAIP